MCLCSVSPSLGTHLSPLSEPGCGINPWCCSAQPFSRSIRVCPGTRIAKIKVQKWAEPQVSLAVIKSTQLQFLDRILVFYRNCTRQMNWTEWRAAVKINWFESWMTDTFLQSILAKS